MTQLSDSEKRACPPRFATEILIGQVGRMTESITGLRTSVEHMSEGITEFRTTMEHSFTELKTVSARQERNIDRLVGIVETLIQERRSN